MSNNEKTGAETLVSTLLDSDVDVCFANPGTSEMHFVAALDDNPGMRCVVAAQLRGWGGGRRNAPHPHLRRSG